MNIGMLTAIRAVFGAHPPKVAAPSAVVQAVDDAPEDDYLRIIEEAFGPEPVVPEPHGRLFRHVEPVMAASGA